jgi:hypothetical protein
MAIGDTVQAGLGRMDFSAFQRAGEAQARVGERMGQTVGGIIDQYQLNKEKRAELTGEIEAMLPQYIDTLTNTGNEVEDKKNFIRLDKFNKGDMNMADLKGLAGELAMRDKVQARAAQNEARTIANEMGRLNLDIAQELKDTRVGIEQDKGVISKLARDLAVETNPKKKELIQVQITDAINDIGMNPQRRALESEVIESRRAILPGETSLQIKKQEVGSKQLDVENEVFDIIGIPGLAQIKADDLKTLSETNKAKLEGAKSYASYIRNKGYADLISAANKSSPTFKEQFKPIVELQGTILSKTVEVPGENKIVKFSEYLDLHQEDSDKYPMTGLAGELNAQFKSLDLSAQNLLRDQQVQVNVPDEPQVSATTSIPTSTMGQSYDYSNLDPSIAELMAGPGAVTPQITDPAVINILEQGGTFRGKNLEQLIAEGAIRGQ